MSEHAPDERPALRVRTRTILEIAIGIVCLFAILLAVGVIARTRADRELKAAVQSAQNTAPQVAVIRPEPALQSNLTVAATTQAMQDTVIYARTTGYLSRRHVDIGDHVSAGQLLAEIASPEIDQQLRQAQADLRQSERNLELQKATLDLARITMGRYQAADAERAVAKEAVDQSVAAVRTGQAAVAAAEATVASNTANVQHFQELTSFERVTAPFAGTITQRNVDVGALIMAGSPTNNTAVAPSSVAGGANGLLEIAQIDRLRVFVNVPQAYAANVHTGLPASVSVRGQLTEPITGTVTRTASALDPGTRTLLVESTCRTRRTACCRGCSSTWRSRSTWPARGGACRPPRPCSMHRARGLWSSGRVTSCTTSP